MKWKEIYMICGEEMQHIPSGNEKQNRFRACYDLARRRDLGVNPATGRRDSLVRCLDELKRNIPDFSAKDLEIDTDFFGPLPE